MAVSPDGCRILLGWEVGEQRGHILRMRDVARRLRAEGARIAWAVLRLDQLDAIAEPDEPAFQAPVWPGLHAEVAFAAGRRRHASHADILGDLGLDRPGAFGRLLAGWDAILAATRPDAVFADYAPGLIAACAGRVPVVAAGIGFTLPPAHLRHFPLYPVASRHSEPDAEDATAREARRLDEVDGALRAMGRGRIDRLPALFDADLPVVASFRELDPYAAHRLRRHAPPFLDGWSAPARAPGDEIVVYGSSRTLVDPTALAAFGRLGRPVTIVAPDFGPGADRDIGSLPPSVTVTNRPVPFGTIAARARLVVSNGNGGFASAALLAGLPHVVLHTDIQKRLVGSAIEGLGAGLSLDLCDVDWTEFPARVAAIAEDPDAGPHARRAGAPLIARMHADPAAICADALLAFAAGQSPPVSPRDGHHASLTAEPFEKAL